MKRRNAWLGQETSIRAMFLLGTLVAMSGSAGSCNGSSSDAATDDGSERTEDLPEEVPSPDTGTGDDADPDDGPDVGSEDHGTADADADAESTTDEDADGDIPNREDIEADADDGDVPDDGGTGLPTGCWFARPTTDVAFAWAGRDSIDDGKFVWRWIDSSLSPDEDVLMVRDLALRIDRELLRRTFPAMVNGPSIHGEWIDFFSQTSVATTGSGEIFRVSLLAGVETQLTSNTNSDSFQISGDDFVVYRSSYSDPEAGTVFEYRYFDVRDSSEHVIATNYAGSEVAFDGHRWVAYTGADRHGVYKFDLLDPAAGPQPIGPDGILSEGMAFDRDTGTLIITTYRPSRSADLGLEAWDMATETTSDVLDDTWSEIIPDVDGHVVVYLDSEAAGESYWAHERSDIRIVDRETGAVRVVLPLDTYYGVGIWERWIAVNNYGLWGDSLITCDLVEGGFMSDDLHVVPE